jgi:hypothetical protein
LLLGLDDRGGAGFDVDYAGGGDEFFRDRIELSRNALIGR